MTNDDDIARLFGRTPDPLGKRMARWRLLYLRWLYSVRIDRYERQRLYWEQRRADVLHELAKGDEQ